MPEKILILKKIERDMMKIYIFLRVMYPLLLSDFNYTWILLIDFFKNTLIWTFIKIFQVEAQLFLLDGDTDMTKLIVSFCNFSKASKNS